MTVALSAPLEKAIRSVVFAMVTGGLAVTVPAGALADGVVLAGALETEVCGEAGSTVLVDPTVTSLDDCTRAVVDAHPARSTTHAMSR